MTDDYAKDLEQEVERLRFNAAGSSSVGLSKATETIFMRRNGLEDEESLHDADVPF